MESSCHWSVAGRKINYRKKIWSTTLVYSVSLPGDCKIYSVSFYLLWNLFIHSTEPKVQISPNDLLIENSSPHFSPHIPCLLAFGSTNQSERHYFSKSSQNEPNRSVQINTSVCFDSQYFTSHKFSFIAYDCNRCSGKWFFYCFLRFIV